MLGRYAPGTRRASGPVPVIADVRPLRTLNIIRMKFARLLVFGYLTVSAVLVSARPVRFVSYQELFDKSDLVVIATPTLTTDTKEKTNLPGVSVTNADNKPSGLEVVGVETKFRVSVVLKGDKTLQDFTMHHYREAIEPKRPVINGVMLVRFFPDKKGSFILFLVRETNGSYAPFDQTDPALLSVQALTSNSQSPGLHGFKPGEKIKDPYTGRVYTASPTGTIKLDP